MASQKFSKVSFFSSVFASMGRNTALLYPGSPQGPFEKKSSCVNYRELKMILS